MDASDSNIRLDYDVVFLDQASSVYVEDTPMTKGIGGSELSVITLSSELARSGFSVLVLNSPLVLKGTEPSPLHPIVAASGVHYASSRAARPPLSCGALVVQRSTIAPPDPRFEQSADAIQRDRTVVWVHDACNNPNDTQSNALRFATSKPVTKGGAQPVFVSQWERTIYPRDAVGKHSRVIPNMLPRLVYDERWKSIPQEDTFVYASAAIRGLDNTLKAWSEPRIAAAGTTVLEIMGPAYDPPPTDVAEVRAWNQSLQSRVRFCGSLPLPQLLERLAASRGLLYASNWLETFCLVIAYSEAMGKPARFISLLNGIGAVDETMVNRKYLYRNNDWDRFINDIASEISSDERLSVEPVRKFHPDEIMPMWFEALGLEA